MKLFAPLRLAAWIAATSCSLLACSDDDDSHLGESSNPATASEDAGVSACGEGQVLACLTAPPNTRPPLVPCKCIDVMR